MGQKARGFICFVFAFLIALLPIVDTNARSKHLSSDLEARLRYAYWWRADENICKNKNSTTDGSNVTIIGDSITEITAGGHTVNGAKHPDNHNDTNDFEEYLPEAEIYAQWGKSFFADGNGGESGIAILDNLIANDSLREILVFALGTNDNGSLTYDKIKEVVEKAGEDRTVVFMTMTDNGKPFTANNELVERAANDFDSVVIADWAGAAGSNPNLYIDQSDTVHPSIHDGTKLFAETIYEAISCTSDTLPGGSCTIQGYGNNANDHWNGSCSGVGSYDSWINAHIDDIQTIAKRNGIPWEALLAQTIQESSGAQSEVCPYNPLGLKTNDPSKACDSRMHRSFSSYQEAFQYYVDSIIPVREAKYKYPNDPYMYLDFIQHGATYQYAQDTQYVQKTSSIVCGIQKWAEAHGRSSQLSSRTYRNYSHGTISSDTDTYTSDVCYDDIDEDYGLTLEQAKRFVINYGANRNGSSSNATGALWDYCNGGGSNCVTFSAFFVNKFTPYTNYSGNGSIYATRIGAPTGTVPKVFSVFSSIGNANGHTGVILGRHDGVWIVAHASCDRDKRGAGNGLLSGDGSAFVVTETRENPNNGGWSYPGGGYSNYRFAYLKDKVDLNKIMEYLQSGI